MPRRPRVVVPGIAHHITQRGNNRQAVFLSPGDRCLYLQLLSRIAPAGGVRILGYCLMTNHVHLIAVPESETSLARTLGRAHSEYALAVNRDQRRTGHVWQNRFFSCPMEESHLYAAMRYVELNPVRASMISVAWEWPWSSAAAHALDTSGDPVLDSHWKEYFGGWDGGAWKEMLTAGADETESAVLRRATLTGEPLGSAVFLARLERAMGRVLRVRERGRPKRSKQSLEALRGKVVYSRQRANERGNCVCPLLFHADA
jgi:putative transposase